MKLLNVLALFLSAPLIAGKLGEPTVTKAQAEKACSRLPKGEREACVFDVMATGDLDMADAGF